MPEFSVEASKTDNWIGGMYVTGSSSSKITIVKSSHEFTIHYSTTLFESC